MEKRAKFTEKRRYMVLYRSEIDYTPATQV
jgi:hypothetical protein